jgi:hypothetical protein
MSSLFRKVAEHFENTRATPTPLAATASRASKMIHFLFGPHPRIKNFPEHTFFDALTDTDNFHAF